MEILFLGQSYHNHLTFIKGTRSTQNLYLFYNFFSYHHLPPFYCSFLSLVSFITIPKNVKETFDDPRWRQAMIIEIQALN